MKNKSLRSYDYVRSGESCIFQLGKKFVFTKNASMITNNDKNEGADDGDHHDQDNVRNNKNTAKVRSLECYLILINLHSKQFCWYDNFRRGQYLKIHITRKNLSKI